MKNLLKEERQQFILESLQQNKKVTVTDLAEQFGTSEVTIRRDLHELAEEGKLVRAHRGALAATPAPPEPPVVQRMSLEQHSKERLGQAAAHLVQDGESVFIGSGSTAAFVARALAHRKNLTVMTNSIGVAMELFNSDESLTVVFTGGVLRKQELSLLGHIAELTLPELRVDKVIMGVQALDADGGWTTDHLPEVTTTRRIIGMSRKLIVVADHTKLGRMAAAFIAPTQTIDILVTDGDAPQAVYEPFEKLGVEVIRA